MFRRSLSVLGPTVERVVKTDAQTDYKMIGTALTCIGLGGAGLNAVLTVTDKQIDRFRDETNRGFDNVNRRFDEIDKKFDQIDKKFDKKFDDLKSDIVELKSFMKN